MNRRAFLTAAPAAMLTGSITASVPRAAPAAPLASPVCAASSEFSITASSSSHDQTPIARLFAEWQRLHAWSNEPGIPDDEHDRRVHAEIAVEREIGRTPAVSVQDLAKKAFIEVGSVGLDCSAAFWSEVCGLAGVPVSRAARYGC